MDAERLRRTIASAKRGQADGYAALLEAYGPRLYGYFLRATGRHHDAEDLLSELTLRLVRRLKSYDERGRFDQWVFRIAANMVRDRIRRLRSGPGTLSLSWQDESQGSLGEQLPADGPAVDAAALAEEASAGVQQALGKLDDMTRQMVLLRYFGELSFKELAELFQCPLGTALARVHRGLGVLRKEMKAEDALD